LLARVSCAEEKRGNFLARVLVEGLVAREKDGFCPHCLPEHLLVAQGRVSIKRVGTQEAQPAAELAEHRICEENNPLSHERGEGVER